MQGGLGELAGFGLAGALGKIYTKVARGKVKYIHDITTDQQIMDKPISTNIKGEKTLELRPFFN